MISCKKLNLEGAILFNLECHSDNRGSFTEVFNSSLNLLDLLFITL